MLRKFVIEPPDRSVIEKVLRYQITHPLAQPRSFAERFGPTRVMHRLRWMTVMVSREDAKVVFGQAFSRPPRLLFGNPVAFIFSAYYAYIFGEPSSVLDSQQP